MKRIGQLADRMVSAFVPKTTASAVSAAGCTDYYYCQACGSSLKSCWSQWCDGRYINGACGLCGYC
ncbi:hypothetical protein ACFY2R_20460 [Micromonospora olivasterospora]|uniref:Uncharacterized protein n=1 Tax=Micromonospora olivasterospora TaxID=1880 RepID=A0A562IHU0_MICOL|nr:hypothetical protein [Micromonospora olivasterospora]TWH70386.1 hypothetical protein JD77_05411 [Micromonospora olivasterospora]